ncbi:Amyloid beta A4 precursor protein-binding family B member 1-interacting protein [Liparis tanakae]|uniref:Amyloid beta A4 protein-binding family B member 1-interacting protein n=1 Tax=Liparis tanakae TaxID=230148 RepID=A0A4Z2IW27_9TELE|nr:Amyloid beta A4 precursor protein-binding family B member 1-interacting protein [Liparis tanakae]
MKRKGKYLMMDDIDTMFNQLLGEMDHLSQSLLPAEGDPGSQSGSTFSIGFTDLNGTSEPRTKAEKIKLALEKLKEAKVRKLIVKVLMSDGSSKTLMVDERQTVREVLDTLFEKTHCDCSMDWSLCETSPELQMGYQRSRLPGSF